MKVSPQQAKALQRLKVDYRFYAAKCLKIRTKDGEVAPLRLNAAQDILDEVVSRQMKERRYVRIIILKGRQQGLSTDIGGRLYQRTTTTKGFKTMVVGLKGENTKTLFDLTHRYHRHCPEMVKPKTSASSTKALEFPDLDSSYTVASAGGDGPGRGETLQGVHASEMAFWKANIARQNWNGLKKAVPPKPGTMIFIESTANGVGNLFHELWVGAVNGTNEYEAVFIPWILQEEYRKPLPKDGFERTSEEQKYADKAREFYDIELDDEQLMFRRLEIGESGLELFKQEYPLTAEEAFLTSGRPVFDAEKVADQIKKAVTPRKVMALEGDEFRDHLRGELKVYQEPRQSGSYFLGVDPSSGIKGAKKPNGEYEKDPACIQVLDENKLQVAVWRGYCTPDYLAEVAVRLGEYYNLGMIAVERNNHGGVPIYRLTEEFYYPHLYQVTSHDKTTNVETVQVGFDTNVKTRFYAIDTLRQDYRLGKIQIQDKKTLEEMSTFVVTESGKMEGEEGCHDDTVMALAIANAVHDGENAFVDTDDSHYQEGI